MRHWLVAFALLAAGLALAPPASAGSVDGYEPGPCIVNAVGPHSFVDVAPGEFYSNAVGWAALNDITEGTDPTHFSPAAVVSRAQFATFLWRMVCEPGAAGLAPFVDILRPSFYAAAVDWLWDAGHTTGRTTTTYVPDGDLTRAEFATFLFRLAGEPGGAPPSGFVDVVADSFYEDAVDWLKWRALTTGTSPTTFEPNRSITRAEAVTFLYRLNLKADGIIDPADLDLGFDTVLSGLSSPVAAAVHPVDGSIFIAEQGGRLLRVPATGAGDPDWGAGATEVWSIPAGYSLPGCGECGLLGVAVSPDGGHIYLSFTASGGSQAHRSIVLEYALVGGVPTGAADELFDVEQPYTNHNGGHLAFGPDDLLYLSFGDGGSGGDPEENGQDLNTLLGKILRVDPSGGPGYTNPESNPFHGGTPGYDQIFAVGVRNPWKFSFDTETGDLWVADVGQDRREEFTRLEAHLGGGLGANLGWDTWEGTYHHEPSDPPIADHVGPTYEYTTNGDEGGSITGGFVYRGDDIVGLNGTYLWADFKEPELRGFNDEFSGGAIWFDVDVPGGSVTSFVQDLHGEVYAISRGGSISKVVPA
ncbi:MAG: PQQ-dependent sugar dehydrogenase [Acidimicrobiales bacterium]|nr:PQQ-dependent sugar dehydrogenase [Acidimicrobiales bacterium]